MRLLTERVPELNPNLRWDIATRLQLIEDVVLGPQDSGIGTPTMEEATDRMRRAVEARDKKAEDEAIMDYMRAEVMAWWQDFPERQLLTDLYQRAARWRAATGSLDSRRRPSYEEGLRVAKGLLVGRTGLELWGSAKSKYFAAASPHRLECYSPSVLNEVVQIASTSW